MIPCTNFNSQTPVDDINSKRYFHEIGAAMLGNQLILRVEKEKNKKKKKQSQWNPPCDCEIIEIKRPTAKRSPKIVNAENNSRILFKIQSESNLKSKFNPNSQSQTIAYKIESPRESSGSNNCRTITVHPPLKGSGAQEVFSEHITERDENVFLLRIKKKDENSDQTKRNVEVEFRTPKPPCALPLPPQCPPVVECPLTEEPKEIQKSVESKKTDKKSKKKKSEKKK